MALNPKLKNLMAEKAVKHQEPVEPQNEYLSDQKWDELHERITQHMIPLGVCADKETTRPFYEAAMEATSNLLAGVGVLPESERAALGDCEADGCEANGRDICLHPNASLKERYEAALDDLHESLNDLLKLRTLRDLADSF